jgi:glycosyltransferase involved in cell wall biosynthesis
MGEGTERATPALPGASLLYVHGLAPPTPGGVSMVVHLLLSRLPAQVDTFTDLALRGRVRRGGLVVPGRYHFVPRLPRWARRRVRLIGVVQTAGNALLAVAAGLAAARVARRRETRWVLSVADDGFSVIAGSVCARTAGLPHLVWVFDPWEENAYGPAERWLAQRLERRIWRNAAAVIVHADEMAEHYACKHGVRCAVLPTPVDMDGWERLPVDGTVAAGGPREMLVAGAVYWLQADAVRRLAQVCRGLEEVRLTVLSDPALLDAHDLDADRFEPSLSPERFRSRLREADVLFIGLSFDADAPLAVRTSTPARLPEYLASGRPILVHAPPGSHLAEYTRRAGFGALVDRPDNEALRETLERLLVDEAGNAERARVARRLARERHGADAVAAELWRILTGAM